MLSFIFFYIFNCIYYQIFLITGMIFTGSVEAALESRGLHARTDALFSLLLFRTDRQSLSPIFEQRSLAKLARADRCTRLLTRARRTAGFRFPRKDAPSVRSTRAVEPGRNRRDRSGSTRAFTNDTRWRDFNQSRRPSRFRLRDYIKTANVRYGCQWNFCGDRDDV